MCAKYILESVLYWTEEYHIDGFRFDLMGLLDVDLMNRIRRALDDRYGRGEKILFGEPWAATETAMEGNAVPALKKNIALLDENIGMFCDDTRDAVKGFRIEDPAAGLYKRREGDGGGHPPRRPGMVPGFRGIWRRSCRRKGAVPDHYLCIIP